MSDELCINTIRVLAADIVQKANSGHPGAPMGMAPIAHLLWTKFLKYNPGNPKWINRDRFVLSNGHACALQYIMLHLTGYEEFTMDELKRFRQLGSKTPGHPESHLVNGGIEVSTGPLGQGISNAVGLAIAEAHLAAVYNKPGLELFNNYTFAFCGDGCLQEGISSEAGSLAGHLGLGRLIVLYDDNHVTIDGSTELSFSEDVAKRYEAYGWHVQVIPDGDSFHNLVAIAAAIDAAKKITDRPSLIKVRTTIGFGSSKAGTEKVHGSPLGAEEVVKVKKLFGFNPDQFFVVPDEVKNVYGTAKERGRVWEAEWNQLFAKYRLQYPEQAAEIERRFAGKLPESWRSALPTFKFGDPEKATRQLSQVVINNLGKVLPELIGGSADLNPSTLSYLDFSKDFQKNSPEGRNIRFGVREHAMIAICNGLAAYGGFIPYGASFLNFIGYATGAFRLSALSRFGVLMVMTHDSIGLGEDGPTHQPVESLMGLRALPVHDVLVLRPADGNEVSGAYAAAIENRHRPSVLALTRQGVPHLQGTSIEGVFKGAYVLSGGDDPKPQIILVGTGSETHLAVNAAAQLSKEGVRARVVSFPSWELFRDQPVEYQLSVFPDGSPVLAVEAGSVVGWREYAHAVVGMTTFGASAPYKEVFSRFGFTVDNVVKRAKAVMEFYANRHAASPVLRP